MSTLSEAMLVVEAAEFLEQAERPTVATVHPPAANPEAERDRLARLRAYRLPLIQAYLDMRQFVKGNNDLDVVSIQEMDVLTAMVERAAVNS